MTAVSKSFQYILKNFQDTEALGRKLGQLAQPGDVILLHGDLGVGKTTLTQFIAQGLEVPEDQYVSSPSFALMHEYPGRLPLFHMDCYRLAGEEDIEGAGLVDYIGGAGLAIIEWPDRLGSLQPKERLDLFLEALDETTRQCILWPQGESWSSRIAALSL
ncbi:MAG: tRNA (adenosine(37)-N6)-threonylcarbamoyltransferase complex ATPase subunit type 1 TsaE [Candidatus Electrothrix aestuarii]|uniref:tRNA threonylcarbamoyladenosine biosynthesis protein TsaE n=1 Tax=Candidatus Electrothrix aestuarii TaxID=3062594 RepID=A0AAU8M0E2_9BACT|nr:tRNA (adenosine(37)-N6)-threonylcarbamoyltransferase complex ATPase subunit type 1 TsaE [Candidatus Electrothrix aestuarii]